MPLFKCKDQGKNPLLSIGVYCEEKWPQNRFMSKNEPQYAVSIRNLKLSIDLSALDH